MTHVTSTLVQGWFLQHTATLVHVAQTCKSQPAINTFNSVTKGPDATLWHYHMLRAVDLTCVLSLATTAGRSLLATNNCNCCCHRRTPGCPMVTCSPRAQAPTRSPQPTTSPWTSGSRCCRTHPTHVPCTHQRCVRPLRYFIGLLYRILALGSHCCRTHPTYALCTRLRWAP